MSTTTLQLRSLPESEGGVSLTTSNVAWQFSEWKQLGQFTRSDLYIYGLLWQVTKIAAADTPYQVLFEIGLGVVGREVTKIQIPHSFRNDTAVGYYFDQLSVFLPEPFFVPQYSTISVRVAYNDNSSTTFDGVKLKYMGTEAMVPPSVSNDNIENFKSVSAGDGISVSERSW